MLDRNPTFHDIKDLLVQPGVRLVMPSEETDDVMTGLNYSGIFDRTRFSDSTKGPTHDVSYTTYARVYVNEVAEPYMKDEKLRFPVGSMIVREKLLTATTGKPDLVAAMIKRRRGFDLMTNDWEFVVIDKNMSRVRRDEHVTSCRECHATKRDADFLFKSYLK